MRIMKCDRCEAEIKNYNTTSNHDWIAGHGEADLCNSCVRHWRELGKKFMEKKL